MVLSFLQDNTTTQQYRRSGLNFWCGPYVWGDPYSSDCSSLLRQPPSARRRANRSVSSTTVASLSTISTSLTSSPPAPFLHFADVRKLPFVLPASGAGGPRLLPPSIGAAAVSVEPESSGGRAPVAPPLRPAFGTPPRRLPDPHSRDTRRYRRTRPHRRYATTPFPSRLLDTRSHSACRRRRTRLGPHRATTPSPSSPLQPSRIPVDGGYPQTERILLPCLGFSEP
jgi:hypothetical protein